LATLKYSSTGVQEWVVRYDHGIYDFCQSLALDNQGNIYIAGGGTDYSTFKYSPSGQVLWSIVYNGPQNGDDEAAAIALDPAGNVYVTGQSGLFGNRDYATVKYNQLSTPDLTLEIIPYLQPIQIPASGGSFDYLLRITNSGSNPQSAEIWAKVILPSGHVSAPLQPPTTTILNPGVTAWQRRQIIPAAAPAGSYSYMVCAGEYPGEIWASDTLTMTKLGINSGTCAEGEISGWLMVEENNSPGQPSEGAGQPSLHCRSFNSGVEISYQISTAGNINLRIYDIAGRLINHQEWQNRQPGMYQFSWQTQAAGVYLVRLETAGEVRVAKAVVVR
jgi:hypothetical protein